MRVVRNAAKRKAVELSAGRVLEELRRIAFADIRGFFNVDGHLKPVTNLGGGSRFQDHRANHAAATRSLRPAADDARR